MNTFSNWRGVLTDHFQNILRTKQELIRNYSLVRDLTSSTQESQEPTEKHHE